MSPSVKRLREDDDNAASEKRLSYYIHFDASSFMSAGQYDDFLLPYRNNSYYSLQEVGYYPLSLILKVVHCFNPKKQSKLKADKRQLVPGKIWCIILV